MNKELIDIAYLAGAVCFILAMKLMNSPRTARKGNQLAMLGMGIAIGATFFNPDIKQENLIWIAGAVAVGTIGGLMAAYKVQMTAMPQMVALLNGLGGGAVALVALFEFLAAGQGGHAPDTVQRVTTVLSAIIGTISFSGSLIAYGKLQELLPGRPLTFKGHSTVNLLLAAFTLALAAMILFFGLVTPAAFITLMILSLVLGISAVSPIGGADMPVVISLLNSFTGCAAGLAGFVLLNTSLLIGGALVGASGLILTLQMCVAMNRTLGHVLFSSTGMVLSTGSSNKVAKQPKS
ncbi:MAG: NAD(P)(+) transhydrogenase (Re/Si-specific) subunit beta, partial [Nitrospirae bacterium]|nr:NAD(P)(+) transhydrogenase (Re/Si-specific) subunit beta [Fimbriimonadaceae bacterium]